MIRDDELEEALARAPYLDDDGFTDRVLRRLPPRRGATATAVVLGCAVASVTLGCVLLLGPAAQLPAGLAEWLVSGGAAPVASLAAFATLAAGGLLVAFAD